jgi:hypothetical protein
VGNAESRTRDLASSPGKDEGRTLTSLDNPITRNPKMQKKRLLILILSVCLCMTLTQCTNRESAFKTKYLSPMPDKLLIAGESVTFYVRGDYYLVERNGYMGLFLQDKENRVLAKTFKLIKSGKGSFSISITSVLPKPGDVTLSIAMFKDLKGNSIMALPQSYTVEEAKN